MNDSDREEGELLELLEEEELVPSANQSRLFLQGLSHKMLPKVL